MRDDAKTKVIHNVSIRSPHRSEGRFVTVHELLKSVDGFNPLPPPK